MLAFIFWPRAEIFRLGKKLRMHYVYISLSFLAARAVEWVVIAAFRGYQEYKAMKLEREQVLNSMQRDEQ